MNEDMKTLVTWGLSALLLVMSFIAVGVILPMLINSHNDGALLLAITITVMFPVLVLIAARWLYRINQNGKN